ncbi:hypothetical protein, partial [Desulforamulus ruminis]|uniref:hypothetical protein n=1 Tax=Desulforamulus ruminis TaxID=1564 RepID=UPI0023542CB5
FGLSFCSPLSGDICYLTTSRLIWQVLIYNFLPHFSAVQAGLLIIVAYGYQGRQGDYFYVFSFVQQ